MHNASTMRSPPPPPPPPPLLLLLALCFSVLSHSLVDSSLSKPVGSDADLPRNKYSESQPLDIEEEIFGVDASQDILSSECGIELGIAWQSQLDAAVYSTPVLERILPQDGVQIALNSVSDHAQILDRNGFVLPQWPVHLEREALYASPLLYDIDGDGFRELIVVTYSGSVLVLDPATANQVVGSSRHPLHVPKLRVSRHWNNRFRHDDDDKKKQKKKKSFEKPATTPKSFNDPLRSEEFLSSLTKEGLESMSLFSAARSSNAKRHLFAPDHGSRDEDDAFAHEYPEEDGFVWVDAHVLATPTLADIDHDGRSELVLAVSYFFDADEYATVKESPMEEAELKNFVAGGIVVMDLHNWSVRWSVHLDLTTAGASRTALIYSSPTVVDFDRDGESEILVGTSLGFVYALHSKDGSVVPGYPLEMAPIEAQIAVADADEDGELDTVVCDVKGHVVCRSHTGLVLWETQISGYSSSNAVFADVDGDQSLDVVVASTSGNVYAFNGMDGSLLANFPVHTNGKIVAAPLVLRLSSDKPSKQIVVSSHDGFLYIIDGASGCTSKLDLGERSNSMTLADDILGNGRMSLLHCTMSGLCSCLASEAPYSPLNAWKSQVQGENGFTSRLDYYGVQILEPTRSLYTVMGRTFSIRFEIVDRRLDSAKRAATYAIEVWMKGERVLAKRYEEAGVYTQVIESPNEPLQVPLFLRMRNEHEQLFEDEILLAFHFHYDRVLKWLAFVPFALSCSLLFLVEKMKPPSMELGTTSYHTA